MDTLNLQQAAALLNIHPVTLQDKARAGEIPGAAKIGRAWVFIRVDLIEYIRSKCPRRALQGDSTEVSECHSSNVRTHRIGGSNSATVEGEYSKVLALPTKQKRGSTTTS
jgi:predicted DNA-binding transcriptional regulator AlpA